MYHAIELDRQRNREPAAGPQPPRVLVVNDYAELADIVRFELETVGYGVEVTSSVSEALRRMRVRSDLDLVISDVRMPGKSGLQLLFAEEFTPTPPPVLLISSVISPKLRRFVEGMGAFVIERPFSFTSLHAGVVRALKKARAGARKRATAGVQ